MHISIIVAMAKNRVIGRGCGLPWRLSTDLKNFKKVTMGKPVIMGRKTYESIGQSLPGRENVILTRHRGYAADDCVILHSLTAAFERYRDSQEIMIAGGADIYRQALPSISKIYLTAIDESVSGDHYFPKLDRKDWRELSRQHVVADKKNEFDFSFLVLQKIPR